MGRVVYDKQWSAPDSGRETEREVRATSCGCGGDRTTMSTCSERVTGENVWNRIQKSSPLKFPIFKPSSVVKSKVSPTPSERASSPPSLENRTSPCNKSCPSPTLLPAQDSSLFKLITVEFCDVSTAELALSLCNSITSSYFLSCPEYTVCARHRFLCVDER